MEESSDLANQLRAAKWYAFDLDDTLHNFRKASAAAVTAVLRDVLEVIESAYSLEDLRAEYKRILVSGTASAFIDGKSSHQYREDRLRQLVRKCSINLPKGRMQCLLHLYEEVLIKSLELKNGVLDLFEALQRHGHKIAVISEGPQDAQERTIEALGLTSNIDYLATITAIVWKTDSN